MISSIRRCALVLAVFCFVTVCQAGNDAWVEVRSKNFTLITDAGEKRGGEVLLRFEQMRSAFTVLFQKLNVNSPVPLEIIAFRNNKELKAVSPMWKGKPVEVAGLFQQGEDRNFIALDLSAENGWGVVFHEYAHLLMNTNLPPRPLWLDEGYADYFSTLTVNGKNVEFGTLPEGRAQVLMRSPWMKSEALFSVQHTSREYNEGDRRNIFYAQSWITVHYMMNQKKFNELGTYLKLTDEKHVPIPEAFKQAFGMTLEQFDKTLFDYFHGRMMYYRAPAPPDIDKGPYQTRVVNSAEKDATVADFKFHSIDHNSEGVAEFKKVLEQDPNNEVANRGMGYASLRDQNFDEAAGYLKRAAASGSKDPRIHFFNAMVISHSTSGGMIHIRPDETSEVRAELLKAVELDPNYAEAYNMLAITEMASGKRDKAIEYGNKAVQLNPRNDYYLMNLANFYMQAEQWDKATEFFNAMKSSSNPMVAQNAEQSLDQIQRMKEFKAKGGTVVFRTENETINPVPDNDRVEVVESSRQPARTASFLKGTLVRVDCSMEPTAMFEVKSGAKVWHFRAEDRAKLVLIGAEKLSCDWKNKPVSINYYELGPGAGDLISLEIQ